MVRYNVDTGWKGRTGYCSIGTGSVVQGIEQRSGKAWSRRDITKVNEGVDRGEKNDCLDMSEQRRGYEMGRTSHKERSLGLRPASTSRLGLHLDGVWALVQERALRSGPSCRPMRVT